MQYLTHSQDTQVTQTEKIERIKTQITNVWFAAVAEQNTSRKRTLLERYRELRRHLELAQNL